MKLQPLEYPPTVANLVRHAAHAFPASEFIVMPNQRLTFGEAEVQSRRLAQRLLHGGVAKGTTVGVLFPQGPDLAVALLAVTRIGAVAVPLSTFFRGPELRRAIRHADVDTILASADLLGRDIATELEAPVARVAHRDRRAAVPPRRAVPPPGVARGRDGSAAVGDRRFPCSPTSPTTRW